MSNMGVHSNWRWKYKIILCNILLCLTTGCVGIHVDEYGARIGSESIHRYETKDKNVVVMHMRFTGVGIFWFPLFSPEYW